jgi:hypothetical protein
MRVVTTTATKRMIQILCVVTLPLLVGLVASLSGYTHTLQQCTRKLITLKYCYTQFIVFLFSEYSTCSGIEAESFL